MVRLPVLGSYSPTAPNAKSRGAFWSKGAKCFLRAWRSLPSARIPIVCSLNALALLASGDATYLPLVKCEAEWASGFSANSMQTRHNSYVMMMLSEYEDARPATQSVMPGLRRLAMEAANGQSAVGSWGTDSPGLTDGWAATA